MKPIQNVEHFILGAFLVLMVSECGNVKEKPAGEILKDPKAASEIYGALISDTIYLDELIKRMMADEKCMNRMGKHGHMMKMMCAPERVDSLMSTDHSMMEGMVNVMVRKMEADSSTCSMMCSKVMENEHLKNYVRKHACAPEPGGKAGKPGHLTPVK